MTAPVLTYASGLTGTHYHFINKWARLVNLLGLTLIGAEIGRAFSYGMTIQFLGQVIAGSARITEADGRAIDLRDMVLGLFLVGIALGYSVLFVAWCYRASCNLRAIGPGPFKFSPGWVAGYFFIPFVNLVQPFRAVQEIWGRSSREPRGTFSKLVAAWWCAVIIGVILQPVLAITLPMLSDLRITHVQLQTWAAFWSAVIPIPIVILQLLIVQEITGMQLDFVEAEPAGLRGATTAKAAGAALPRKLPATPVAGKSAPAPVVGKAPAVPVAKKPAAGPTAGRPSAPPAPIQRPPRP